MAPITSFHAAHERGGGNVLQGSNQVFESSKPTVTTTDCLIASKLPRIGELSYSVQYLKLVCPYWLLWLFCKVRVAWIIHVKCGEQRHKLEKFIMS